MKSPSLASLLLVTRLCLAQKFPEYVQFQGNSSGPTHGVSSDVRKALDEADTSPNASHTVRFSSPGNGDWNWTLQISDVSVPAISNSTPDAHVAFTTWHFSRTDEESISSKRAVDSPVCAYLMDVNFPYNVSSQWNPDDSSCVPALGASCVSTLSAVRTTDNCDTRNAPRVITSKSACAGMLDGGTRPTDGILTQGLPFDTRDVGNGAWAYALTSPYEASNTTAYQAEAERLRIMILTGPDGSEAFCNRVTRTVEIGAEEESASDGQASAGSGQNGTSVSTDDVSNGSGATRYLPHVCGLAVSTLVCGLAAYMM